MISKLLIAFIVAIYASTSLAQNYLDLQPLLDQQNLVMHQMLSKMSQRGATSIGIDNIATCFDWYSGVQNTITTKYNTELNQCVSVSEEAKQLLSAQSAENRGNLEVRGHSVCTQLSNCEAIDDALDFFTCYKTVGSNNSQILYEISAGSESLLNNITVSYQRVDDTERVCIADARNIYVASLSTSATKLNNCLTGVWVPTNPTDAPTTVTTEATEITKEAEATETTEATEATEGQDTTESTETTKTEEATSIVTESPQRVFPEEDIYRYIPQIRTSMWNNIRRL